ncbi:NAD-dependent epimerase/dehydratase family protein [Marinilactibacillus sp. GCM10026970]|uniref:NAD-dependent epimerase/dehydratase family protein n=1 Tax=Marinilactibacillus sp. GCM10026970 TaxID=3252642 RepID=UPI0036146F94
MKKVLITGKTSYIGTEFRKWIESTSEKFEIDTISIRDDSWKGINFNQYDTILHLAGIAHVSRDPKMEKEYYRVNRDLTVALAKKAKLEGATHFIFMSSIIVYGDSKKSKTIITSETIPNPSNFYGKSKLEAEKELLKLQSRDFNIAIIRPPMIYGKDSKGNYPRLSKIARKLPVFPNIKNERSMLHISNLCEFLKLLVADGNKGIFFPQNKEYTNTSLMVKKISKIHNKRIHLTKVFNPLLVFLINKNEIVNKLFGNLVYDKNLSNYISDYQIISLDKSIELTEL